MSRAWLIAVLFVFGGCQTDSDPTTCRTDDDCQVNLHCIEHSSGNYCGCHTDEDCPDDLQCNGASRCQRRPDCRSNQDCPDDTFCDESTGDCRPLGGCAQDVHCAPGSVCLRPEEGCVEGCLDTGDCPLYSVCDLSEQATHPDGLGACIIQCESNEACPLGARCVGGQCFDSPNASHCAPCHSGLACPFETDWCLINPAHDPALPDRGDEFQCAVDCQGRPEICPNGYGCRDVVRLTEDPCQEGTCPFGRRCVLSEDGVRGFCTCRSDEDCSYARVPPTCTLAGCLFPPGRACSEASDCESTDRCADHDGTGRTVCYRQRNLDCSSFLDCLCVDGACVRSGRVCERGEDCNPVCVDSACRIGAACTPDEGLYCPDLR